MRNEKFIIFAAVCGKLDFSLHLGVLLNSVYLFIIFIKFRC